MSTLIDGVQRCQQCKQIKSELSFDVVISSKGQVFDRLDDVCLDCRAAAPEAEVQAEPAPVQAPAEPVQDETVCVECGGWRYPEARLRLCAECFRTGLG